MRRTAQWCVLGLVLLSLVVLPQFALGAPSAGATFTFARPEETETLDPERTTAVSSAEVDYLLSRVARVDTRANL